jgi:cytochrome c oxidase subunit 2
MNWLPETASSFAGRVDGVIWFVTIISLVFFLLITILLVVFAIKYRRRTEADVTPYQTSNHTLEVVWTIIPSILVLLIFGYGLVVFDELRTPPQGAIEVNVTGKQWLWIFEYENGKKSINDLYVPEGVPVKLVMHSDDVIHSFYVPQFRTKQDIVPGMYTYLWFKATRQGEFDIFCAEYCGAAHSGMLGKVKVLSRENYESWLKGEPAEVAKAESASPAERGRELYTKRGCNACHSVDGTPGVGPSFKGIYGEEASLQDGASAMVDENYIRESIFEPQAKIVRGYPPVMPSFKGIVSEEEVADIIAFIKSLK